MKKALFLFLSLSLILLSACNFNKPLRNEMLNYYAQEDNFVELCGEIKSISHQKDTDEMFLEIGLQTVDCEIPLNAETGYGEFVLVNSSDFDFDLAVGDIIVFSSAPMYFYNGHTLPILHLEKTGFVLSLNDGKNNYLAWIKEKFG